MPAIPCPIEPLRRLQSEFKQLVDAECDPDVAFITLRRPVGEGDDNASEDVPFEPHRTYPMRRYANEIRRRGLYARDWGWELSGRDGDPKAWRTLNKNVGENWSEQVASWHVPDECKTMPGCERWQIVFASSDNFARVEKLCDRAAKLIWSVYESPILQWIFGPNRPKESNLCLLAGLWCDVVLHVAIQRLPGVMVATNVFAEDEMLRRIRCMQPGDWTKPAQPPVWVAKVDHFSTASIDCIDAIIANWPAEQLRHDQGLSNIPNYDVGPDASIDGAPTNEYIGLLFEVNNWLIVSRSAPPLTKVDLSEFDELPNCREACEQAIVESYRKDFKTIARHLVAEFKKRDLPLSERVINSDNAKSNLSDWKHEQFRLAALLGPCCRQLQDAMFASGELIVGWEPDSEFSFPKRPIRNVSDLTVHLSELLTALREHLSERTPAEEILKDIQLELRNARRSLNTWRIPLPPNFDDAVSEIFESERQLEVLLDRLSKNAPELSLSSESSNELAVLMNTLRKIASAIGGIGRVGDSAKQLSLDALGTEHSSHNRLTLQKLYTQLAKSRGHRDELTLLLGDTLGQLGELAAGATKARSEEYRQRLLELAERWKAILSGPSFSHFKIIAPDLIADPKVILEQSRVVQMYFSNGAESLRERLVCDLYPCAKDAFPDSMARAVAGAIWRRQIVGPGVDSIRRTYCPTDEQLKSLEEINGVWESALQRLVVDAGCRASDVEQMDASEILRRLATLHSMQMVGGEIETNELPAASTTFVFRLNGDGYFICGCINGQTESGNFSSATGKGLSVLFRLVQSPGTPVSMLELDAGPGTVRAHGDRRSRQEVADAMSLKQIAAKRKQLKIDIEAADSELLRSELESELRDLERHAIKMQGLKGKSRDLNNPNDILRSKLHKQLSRVYNKLQILMPTLANHFRLSCRATNGDSFVYAPAALEIIWETASK
ncbi:MAG: hypothetical protein JWP89_6456 [Schlesneria sp.]|nr:hypothetical protein [Schlesneria sp.]